VGSPAAGKVLFTDAHLREMVAAVLNAEALPAIVQAGHPVLRAQAVPFTGQLGAAELARLIELMRTTMHAAPGVGLAAPQIGIPLQLAVLEDLYDVPADNAAARKRQPLEFFTILNPHYTAVGTETESHYEGCLSVRGWQAVVDRAATIDLAFDDETGSARTRRLGGWQARIAQHETDHLSGTV
jgi:peptide deformylase